MSSTKILLGIDPGLARLGWGIVKVQSAKCKVQSFGIIETKSTQSLDSRLIHLHAELTGIIKKYKPDRVGIEKLFFGKNAKTAMSVGEARGVTILTLSQSKLPYIEFTPAEIKIALTGYGNAKKDQIQKMVKSILCLKEIPKPDDAADALAVAITLAVTREIKDQKHVCPN